MKNSRLVELEQEALKMRNTGNLKRAVELFQELVQKQPNWEHGAGHYDLACCFEDLGQDELARHHFIEALKYDPKNLIFLGGYASFLYLRGAPEEAFESHLQLLHLEKVQRRTSELERTERVIRALGARLGLEEAELDKRLADALIE